MSDNASLRDLFNVLKNYMALKTKTIKTGYQMPKHERNRVENQLKWKKFYLSKKKLEIACFNTILDYTASCTKMIL